MKAVGYKKPLPISAADSLVNIEVPTPLPGGCDLLVEVRAISVNPVDVKCGPMPRPKWPNTKY
jgi:NADPH2:quinone reductase